MRRRSLLLSLFSGAALAALTLPAVALERAFPENVKRGRMTPAPYPGIVIDQRKLQLTPGARIWNQQNMIEMPASVRGSALAVNYTETEQGDIDRVWILTPEEAGRSLSGKR